MTTYDVRGGTSETSEIIILPSDVYRMKIVSATIEDDQFNVQKDGTPEKKFVIVWEVSALTTEQQEAADDDADLEAYIGQKVWQRFAPFYREKRAGGPTNFKAFIDSLRDQGHLEGFDPGNFDPEDLLDIEQRVSVLQYTKTMGDNAGKPGNKVAGVMPLKRKKGKTAETKAEKNTPQTIETDDDLPF